MNIIFAILFGAFFGMALYYAGASNPSKLTAMLRFEYLKLMKIIVFAIGFGSVLLSIANLIGIFDSSHFHIKVMNFGVVIGGLIFGIGFGWAGTCPGTCVAASTGVGYKKALAAVVGGLLGAFCFSLSYGWWDSIGIFDILNYGKITLFKVSDAYDYLFVSSFWGLLIVGLLFMGGAVLIPDNKEG